MEANTLDAAIQPSKLENGWFDKFPSVMEKTLIAALFAITCYDSIFELSPSQKREMMQNCEAIAADLRPSGALPYCESGKYSVTLHYVKNGLEVALDVAKP